MIRKIIRIDEDKCDGCGICITACHEGAIDIIDGKAKLVRENFCDGLGDCLSSCPHAAITFEEREAPEYDDEAVKKMQREKMQTAMYAEGQACPGSRFIQFDKKEEEENQTKIGFTKPVSRLGQWPCQIKLVRVEIQVDESRGESADGHPAAFLRGDEQGAGESVGNLSQGGVKVESRAYGRGASQSLVRIHGQ